MNPESQSQSNVTELQEPCTHMHLLLLHFEDWKHTDENPMKNMII